MQLICRSCTGQQPNGSPVCPICDGGPSFLTLGPASPENRDGLPARDPLPLVPHPFRLLPLRASTQNEEEDSRASIDSPWDAKGCMSTVLTV